MRAPSGSTGLLGNTLNGVGTQAAQSAPFAAFDVPGRPVRLGVGDCLMVFQGAAPGSESGSLDVENQSTVYLRPE